MEIRVMARRGMAVRQIARELGCSRNSVKRYLRDAQASRYGPRSPRTGCRSTRLLYLLSRNDGSIWRFRRCAVATLSAASILSDGDVLGAVFDIARHDRGSDFVLHALRIAFFARRRYATILDSIQRVRW